MVAWCLLNAANYEHVRALGTMPSLNHVYQLTEPAFLWGSAVVVSRPFLLAGLLILIVAALQTMQKTPHLDRQTAWFAALTLSMTLGLPLCDDFEQSAQWRQSHPLALNLSRLWNHLALPPEPAATTTHESRHRVRRLAHTDLSGRSIVPPADQPQNVLLVVLEGVSGAHLEPISRAQGLSCPSPMPQLSKLAAENIAWTQFVAQQRQTDRGLYSIMAGRYPQLNHAPSLMSNYVPDPSRPALPAVLREAGYQTAFLQAADLDYMQKGRFMKSAGFESVMGSESFQTCHFRTGWGPDDLSVMEKGYELIQGLNRQSKPWFLTVFTAGTHHPYEVPHDFHSEFEPGTFEHTAAYADAAVAELLSRLRQDGTLDNTLVLITSDESSGVQRKASDLDCEISHNWGFLVAVTPGKAQQRVDEPFMQSDLALSIVDYLGLADRPHRFVGERFSTLRRAAADSLCECLFRDSDPVRRRRQRVDLPRRLSRRSNVPAIQSLVVRRRQIGATLGSVENGLHDGGSALQPRQGKPSSQCAPPSPFGSPTPNRVTCTSEQLCSLESRQPRKATPRRPRVSSTAMPRAIVPDYWQAGYRRVGVLALAGINSRTSEIRSLRQRGRRRDFEQHPCRSHESSRR